MMKACPHCGNNQLIAKVSYVALVTVDAENGNITIINQTDEFDTEIMHCPKCKTDVTENELTTLAPCKTCKKLVPANELNEAGECQVCQVKKVRSDLASASPDELIRMILQLEQQKQGIEPVIKEPVNEPEPVTEEPVTEEPVTEEPVTEEPVKEVKPAEKTPKTAKSTVKRPRKKKETESPVIAETSVPSETSVIAEPSEETKEPENVMPSPQEQKLVLKVESESQKFTVANDSAIEIQTPVPNELEEAVKEDQAPFPEADSSVDLFDEGDDAFLGLNDLFDEEGTGESL